MHSKNLQYTANCSIYLTHYIYIFCARTQEHTSSLCFGGFELHFHL